jgi:hypothetical protein
VGDPATLIHSEFIAECSTSLEETQAHGVEAKNFAPEYDTFITKLGCQAALEAKNSVLQMDA